MKRLLAFITMTLMTISMIVIQDHEEVDSLSTCSEAPQIYDIYTNVWQVSNGTPFVLYVNFYNDCNHIIKEVLINGELYTVGNGDISGQGYSTTILPNGSRAYRIQIPLVYDSSTMSTSFTITHYIYSEWLPGMIMPEDHIVTVQMEWQADNIFDVDDGLPSDPTSPELVFTVIFDTTATGLVVTNQNTGQSELIPLDLLFYSGLYVNALGDAWDFALNPIGTTLTFVNAALDNWETRTSLTDFAGDTIYDFIMADDGLSDPFLNEATNRLIEQIQLENPSYVFPGDYMWVGGEFIEIVVDENGDPVLDDSGNPIIDDSGNNAGEIDTTIVPTWMRNALTDFGEVVSDVILTKLGIDRDVNLVPIVAWIFEHPGFVLISAAIITLMIFAWPVVGPIMIQLLLLIPKTAIVVFKGLRMFFELLAHQMYSDKTKKAKF